MKEKNNKNEREQKGVAKKELTVKNNKKGKIFSKIINGIKNSVLTNWLGTILLVIILIDVYILVNMGLNNVVLPEFDFTKNKVYTLSEETNDKIKNLDNDVTITLINLEEHVYIAEKYTVLNNKIKLEKIDDLTSRKDLMEKYSLEAESAAIIIASGENATMLTEYDLYTYDSTTYESVDTAEEAITNAIVNVTTEEKPKIYFMSNHAQYDIEYYFYSIMTMMQEEANEVDTVDILSYGSVPEDCDTLVITTLSEDITEREKNQILEYINKGGEILLLTGPNITGKDLTNFQEILNQYGITMEEGIIFEGDSSKMISGYPDLILEKIQSNSITENINMNLNTLLLDAASIKFDEERLEELNVEYEELIYTSSSAFRRTDLTISSVDKTSSDSEEGEFLVGALASKKIDENNTSKLIIFGNELFVSDMGIPIDGQPYYLLYQYNNSDIILNSIAYLNEREDIITIRKAYDAVTYIPTQLQDTIVMAIIFITPLVIIILGIVVWQVRRRKK